MYATTGYFAPTYFGGVWRSLLGPKVIALANEVLWVVEAFIKQLGKTHYQAETVVSTEGLLRSRYMARAKAELETSREVARRVRIVMRRWADVVTVVEARRITKVLSRATAALVHANEVIRRSRVMARASNEAEQLAEVAFEFIVHLGALVRVIAEAVIATETRRRLRVMVRQTVAVIHIPERWYHTVPIIRGLVHSGIRLRALITGVLRLDRKR